MLNLPPDRPLCGFSGEFCPKFDDSGIIIINSNKVAVIAIVIFNSEASRKTDKKHL